jgi:hypothetical protein
MKNLTKILGTLAIAGLVTVGAGFAHKSKVTYAAGAGAFLVGGVGYALVKENKRNKLNY